MSDMNKERARARALVTAAIEREPRLTAFGLGVYDQRKRSPDDVERQFREDRAYLFSGTGLDEVATCARWLELKGRIKALHRGATSYGYKHAVTRWTRSDKHAVESWMQADERGQYISNGALIAAALGLGFDYRPDHDGSPNVVLNLSQRPLTFEREARRRRRRR